MYHRSRCTWKSALNTFLCPVCWVEQVIYPYIYPPLREQFSPMGSHLILFLFISYLRSLFWFQNHTTPMAFFDPPIFYHPEVGSIKDPYGFPIWDLSVLYLSRELFLISKSHYWGGIFGSKKTQMWRMGGSVGGSVGRTLIFCFCLFLKNYLIYHANYFWSP